MILQKEILALLCLLALFENRASYQSEAVDVQSGLCSGLTEEKDQQTLLFVSDIVFFGRILQSYRGVCVCVCVCVCVKGDILDVYISCVATCGLGGGGGGAPAYFHL